jgi:murein DD-endopeptidase MepM/ murein hydrolase activator NlpD
MILIRRIALILLFAVIFYIGWVIYLNLPGHSGPQPHAVVGPPKTIAAPSERIVATSDPLTLPVAGVTAAQLQDMFGDARGDGSRSHGALDIMAPRGTPVLAASAGTVEKLFTSKLGGLTIYIRRPGGGWIDYYAHLDHYADGLIEGQQVTRGQVIGAVGFTGDASPDGPHLHYEIKAMAPGEGWWQGKAVNPYPLLGGR